VGKGRYRVMYRGTGTWYRYINAEQTLQPQSRGWP
jgi:hypothetical protein